VADEADKLKEYRERRDFEKTSEPEGKPEERAGEARFVVQQHDATRMHYDFRIETDGVLKSWAVPQGPSTDPQDKRLAVEVEDHPLDYIDFEGVIPKGEYGAGPVIVWDRGTYENIRGEKKKPLTIQESYREGLIELRLHGEKLKGAYALVQTKFQDSKKNWLMIKMKDKEADPELDIIEAHPQSVKSGKTIKEVESDRSRKETHPVLAALPDELKGKLKQTEYPGWLDPMLATLEEKPFDRKDWIYEQKLDGERCLVYCRGGQVQMLSRNQLFISHQYPELIRALKGLGNLDMVLDGEIVAFDGERPSFERMQKRMHVAAPNEDLMNEVPTFLYLFDILYFEGYEITRLPQIERKNLLAKVFSFKDPVRFTEHVVGEGIWLFNDACAKGLEGVIAKDANAPYQHRRSKSWLKFKCVQRRDVVIGGYTEPNAGMRGFGALLVGEFDKGNLVYRGRVGTGFSDEMIRDLRERLAAMETDENPFLPHEYLEAEGVHWVEPVMVASVGYGDMTKAGIMRHPRFFALRESKGSKPGKDDSRFGTPIFRSLNGNKVKLTNIDKLLFPDDGITKGQVIDYFERIAPTMLPHLKDRPLNMERFPDGIGVKGFYHKQIPDYFPDFVERVEVEVSDTEIQFQAMANNAAALVYLAQYAAFTLHPWLSQKEDLRKPDKIVFDLDPSTDEGWDVVKEGARDVKAMLVEMGLPSFLMATGSRGLHVAVPLVPEHDYDTIQLFAKALCQTMVKRDKKFTTEIRKEKRKDRVFLDYLRNRYGHTSVAPYTLRAKRNAPVAAPLLWEELESNDLRSDSFTISNIFERITKPEDDPWREFFEYREPLPDFDKIQKILSQG
jgi:bifunctional non-homologous end joining protein LigD